MTEELVTYETAILAKQKGFDEVCRNVWFNDNGNIRAIDAPKDEAFISLIKETILKYKSNIDQMIKQMPGVPKPFTNSTLPPPFCTRPTQDLLERWLREVHGLDIWVPHSSIGHCAAIYDGVGTHFPHEFFKSKELARDAAEKKALNLLPDANDK